MSRSSQKPVAKQPTGTLGTFAGVFTPSVLTILGIILFLRLDYVVGNAGFGRALLIIGLANVISVLTSVSLSAIATNLKVKGGGDYYLISRTLGLEFGGAIGLVLFLAQSVSIAFYCIGFGEVMVDMLPSEEILLTPQMVAVAAVCFLFIFAWLGADWATRFQYVVMALLAAALLSFFAGGIPRWESARFVQNWAAPAGSPDFWLLFAIFFPAVTGFTQGVSMSGELKDPGKSLPLGTFMAVGVSILVYFGVALVYAGVLSNETLANTGAMQRIALFEPLIDAGVIAATLSSAMASFLGAPRILQSLAADRIFLFLLPFAKGAGPSGNPRRGVLLAAGIALLTISMGSLNVVAAVVSMFFLISYGLLNYATYFEARAASPSFRPRFKWFDQRLSLLGFLACLFAMLAIDLKTGIVAVSILFAIHQYLKRTAGPARWADSRRAHSLQRIRENILAAAAEPEHPRDWRPQILAFTSEPQRRTRLVRFSSWLEGRSGMTTVVHILEGTGAKAFRERMEVENELRRDIQTTGLPAFPLVMVAPDFDMGLNALLQAYGIGPLRANTILLNWLNQDSPFAFRFKEILFGRHLRMVYRIGCNIVVLHTDEKRWQTLMEKTPESRRIDVWWQGDATSRLMLLLAYLMTRSEPWDEAAIRVLAINYENDSQENTQHLMEILDEARIEAESIIVSNSDLDKVADISADASLVYFPFRLKGDRIAGPVSNPVEELLLRLPTAAMVLASEDIELDAEPEEGTAAEMAAAQDALAEADKKAAEAQQDAEAALKIAEAAKAKVMEFQAAESSKENQEKLSRLEDEAHRAEVEAEKAFRKAAKAGAKVRDAAKDAAALGVKTDTGDN
ncbi:MAG: amino acid permease [Desulfobacterales bacterium]|uniref:Amino acid permease n=1 Tax=Candidatus Desulfatibia vada TaxID=2841696 RepID=A0A8J6P607_9BACT|nr:amino acid permease [Candidatus Desulfatibia vada]MBL6971626.1 amino acid permease [Desulfobacterales bacterium]